jgi:hypothetical protein
VCSKGRTCPSATRIAIGPPTRATPAAVRRKICGPFLVHDYLPIADLFQKE